MNAPFMRGTTSSITMQSLGKIALRALVVGAKMWCLFVCFFFTRSESGAPCVRGVHSSNKHCVAVYYPISTRFSAFFCKRFLFQMHYTVLTLVARGRHNFREIAVKKLQKVQKSAEKFVHSTSYRQLGDLKKIPRQLFRAECVDVHLYTFFAHVATQC